MLAGHDPVRGYPGVPIGRPAPVPGIPTGVRHGRLDPTARHPDPPRACGAGGVSPEVPESRHPNRPGRRRPTLGLRSGQADWSAPWRGRRCAFTVSTFTAWAVSAAAPGSAIWVAALRLAPADRRATSPQTVIRFATRPIPASRIFLVSCSPWDAKMRRQPRARLDCVAPPTGGGRRCKLRMRLDRLTSLPRSGGH